MSEPHAQPPQKPRGLLTIMLILFGTMMLVVMMFRNLQPDEVPWSRFLANVDEGKVTRIEQGSDFIVVTPTKDAGAQQYRVLYPGSRITDNLQSQLEKSINSYNAKVDAGGPEAAGKPIQAFETVDKQVGILAGMSEADQLASLRLLLESWSDSTAELDQMVAAWASGDVPRLEELAVTEMQTETPALYEALLVRRNTDWADQIQTMLAGSGTVFIAVGAAHLAGDDSVQEILGDRGVTVTRE